MENIIKLVTLLGLVVSGSAMARESHTGKITFFGATAFNERHVISMTSGPYAECLAAVPTNPVLAIMENTPGSDALVAMAMLAVEKNFNVTVQSEGCTIVEIDLGTPHSTVITHR